MLAHLKIIRPLTAVGSDLPIRTIPQTNYLKSCYPGIPVGKCSATKKVGWTISGHNEGGVHKHKTWEECLEMCCNDLKCKSFDHLIDGERKCAISHHTMEGVPEWAKDKDSGPKWSYSELSISRFPPKTPKGKKRVAFRTEMGGYLTVDQQGQLTCNSITLEENAIFDLIRPIETGHIKTLPQATATFHNILILWWYNFYDLITFMTW